MTLKSLLEKLTVWRVKELFTTRHHIDYVSCGPTSSAFAHQYNLLFSKQCMAGCDEIEVSV